MIDQQFAPGENTTRTLDTTAPGGSKNGVSDPDKVSAFGQLGEFAKRIDLTAQRSYVESGYIRNVRPRTMEIMHQQPDVTVVVKKRMFSSLIDNYKFELMDGSEKLFLRASKRLFKNKCQAIATYEKLSKIEKAVRNKGVIDEYMLPIISNLVDLLDASVSGIVSEKTKLTIETLQKLYAFSEPSQLTTWITERGTSFEPETGEGTGVFEITLASQVTTNTSVIFSQGNSSLNFEDPYRLMVITEDDIDKAIADAANITQQGFFDFTRRELERLNGELHGLLSTARMRRGASQIKFLTNDDTLLYKRLRAIVEEEGKEIFFNYQPPSPSLSLFKATEALTDFATDPRQIIGLTDPREVTRALSDSMEGLQSNADIDQNSISEHNQLQGQEIELFKQIVDNTFKLMNLRRTQDREIQEYMRTPELEYAREKMRLHFANKPMIQPMDSVHVYASSKTRMDDQVLGVSKKLLTGNWVMSSINSTIDGIGSAWDDIRSLFGATTSGVEIEKNSIVGPDFPTWLWTILRNDFTRQAAGVHIFGGIVSQSDSQYTASDGKHTVSVSVQDNTYYFKMGQINLKPSVEVYNTPLYDPLTPYKLEFDGSSGFLTGEIPDLLDENIALLQNGCVRSKNGKYRNVTLTPTIYASADGEIVRGYNNSYTFRRIFYDPDGFVYRWKSGIGALTLFGDPHPSSSLEQERSIALTKNPFAGQDAMNVLSLLITAQPYNFNTFVNGALKSGNLTRDDLRNEPGSVSYYRGLLSDLTKANLAWGNFIPFKQLVVSEKSYNILVSAQFDVTEAHAKLNKLIEERAREFDTLAQTGEGSQFAGNPQVFNVDSNGRLINLSGFSKDTAVLTSRPTQKAAQTIAQKDLEILRLKEELYDKIANPNVGDGSIKIFGDDISFEPEAMSEGEPLTEESRLRQRKELRDKLNTLTLRRLWKVKANEDPNLFIVDDQYDKNYDIQAFEKTLAKGMELLKSDYKNVWDQINTVKNLLGLEVFADSQGHIRARPPGFNKVPSSVFYKMVREKEKTGKRIFPKILEDLFLNQIEGLTDQIEIIEDEIRLRTAKLGYTSDTKAETFLAGSNWLRSGPQGSFRFKFVSGESNGRIGGYTHRSGKMYVSQYRSIVQQSLPDLQQSINNGALEPFDQIADSINEQLRQNALFDADTQIKALNNPELFLNIGRNEQANTSKLQEIRERLELKKGMTVSEPEVGSKQVDLLRIVNDIAGLISERQSLLKIYSSALKNVKQSININADTNTSRALLFPNVYNKTTIPSLIEHMIENEEIDDIGENSGKRYVIRDSQIISLKIEEKPPDFTVVEATGLYGEGWVAPPNSLSIGSQGNAVTTAYATDYDMWKMYGFKPMQSKMFPFLSDPDAQLAPMAVWLLNNERRKIFQGNLTIAGNEYMQPGEVIYIEDRDMLFYVETVTHSISYGGTFTTNLKLSYGHNPGEYIPTMLDIVGKALYSKKHQANLVRHSRHGNSDGSTALNVLIGNDTGKPFNTDIENLVSGVYGEDNRKSLTNLLFQVDKVITPGLNEKLILEFRVYYNSQRGVPAVNSNLQAIAGAAIAWLKNPQRFSGYSNSVMADNTPVGVGLADNSNVELRVELVDLGAADSTGESEREIPVRSPSSHAWHMARALNERLSIPVSDQSAGTNLTGEARVLLHNIIDIWARFEKVEESIELRDLVGKDQAAYEVQQEVEQTFYVEGARSIGTEEERADIASLTNTVGS